MLYELLTGQKPFTAETPVAIALKQMKDPMTHYSQLVPGIPEEVEKVIFKALARNPDDRYESMEAFYKALAGTISPEAISLRSAERGVEKLNSYAVPHKGNRESPDRRGRGWLWGLVSLGVVAGILFVVMEVTGGNGDESGRSAFDDAVAIDLLSNVVLHWSS